MTFEDCVCCPDAKWNYGKYDELETISCGMGKTPSTEQCKTEGE